MIQIKSLLREVQSEKIEQKIEDFLKEYQATSCAAYVYKDSKPLFEFYKNADQNSVFGIGSVSGTVFGCLITSL